MANKPAEFPVFTPLDGATVQQQLAKVASYLHNIAGVIKVDSNRIETSMEMLYEVIERVEKQRVYFHVFHQGCKMGEFNEGALLCYWILKLTPFSCPGIHTNVLNAKIALCLFINVIYYCTQKTGTSINLSSQMCNNLYYAFRFRDLSKEAIMVLAESMIQ
jgi:hypothetical protein